MKEFLNVIGAIMFVSAFLTMFIVAVVLLFKVELFWGIVFVVGLTGIVLMSL